MSDDLYLIISFVRKEDMRLLKYFLKTKSDTYLGQNYMYWGEEDVAKEYAALFDYDEEVNILAVEEIQGFIEC